MWATFAACNQLRYILLVIESFRHKGLRKFFESGDLRGIAAPHRNRIRHQLDVLDAASEVTDMNLPAWRLHQLKGSRGNVGGRRLGKPADNVSFRRRGRIRC